jgi:hypothetical protein
MNSLLLAAALLSSSDPDGWWNTDWKFRRPVRITNRLDRPLEKGFTVQIEIDPDYLGIRAKSKAGLEDWALVRGGERVPFLLAPGRGKSLLLSFRTAADIAGEKSDGYHLYYGFPEAPPFPVRPDQVYDLWEDFSRPESLAERFVMDKDLTAAVQDGALVIRDVAAGRNATTPVRLAFRSFPTLPGFELSLDVEMESSAATGAGFEVSVDLKEPGANDPSVGRKADELIEKLGDDAWQEREKATKALIALGRPAVAKLTEAAKSTDAEVKWRADHILKEIRERDAAPRFSAGITSGDPAMPIAFSAVIGSNRNRFQHRGGWPVKARITIQRDPDGEVRLLWNGRLPQSGRMPGDLQQVALTIHKAGGVPLGTIRVDNIMVRRFIDDDSRPASTVDVEEARP